MVHVGAIIDRPRGAVIDAAFRAANGRPYSVHRKFFVSGYPPNGVGRQTSRSHAIATGCIPGRPENCTDYRPLKV